MAVCSQCRIGGYNNDDDDFYDGDNDDDEPIFSQIEIERANFGCDFDFNRKQQTRLLEGEYECFLKLHKPITFQVGDDDDDDGDDFFMMMTTTMMMMLLMMMMSNDAVAADDDAGDDDDD